MEVEDHDGGHHTASHHEHDAVEVGSYRMIIIEVWNGTIWVSVSQLPIKGLSEVIGMISDTVLRNIVRDSKIVTPLEYQKLSVEDRQPL